MARGAAILAVLQNTAYFESEPNWTAPVEEGTTIHDLPVRGLSGAPAGDVNGDGFDDLLFAAGGRENGPESGYGKVYLFLGSASGMTDTAAWTATGESVQADFFGIHVASLGDVNGDGFDDIAVSSRAGLLGYSGSASGPVTPPFWHFDAIIAAPAGDVDGDGFGDVIAGDWDKEFAFLFLGSPSGLGAAPVWTYHGDHIHAFGHEVRGLGDINRDGFDDVAIGGDGHRFGIGGVTVFHGSAAGLPSAPTWEFLRPGLDEFGGDIDGGDFNGDGFAGLLTAAMHAGGPEEGGASDDRFWGRVYVFHGSAVGLSTNPVFTHEPNARMDFGRAVENLSDIDGDGLSEIAVWSRVDVQIFRGAAVGYETPAVWSRAGGGVPRRPAMSTAIESWIF